MSVPDDLTVETVREKVEDTREELDAIEDQLDAIEEAREDEDDGDDRTWIRFTDNSDVATEMPADSLKIMVNDTSHGSFTALADEYRLPEDISKASGAWQVAATEYPDVEQEYGYNFNQMEVVEA